jgi:hypothetical protein
VPPLDLVIYKMGGNNDPTLTDAPQPEPSHACDDWKAIVRGSLPAALLGIVPSSAMPQAELPIQIDAEKFAAFCRAPRSATEFTLCTSRASRCWTT